MNVADGAKAATDRSTQLFIYRGVAFDQLKTHCSNSFSIPTRISLEILRRNCGVTLPRARQQVVAIGKPNATVARTLDAIDYFFGGRGTGARSFCSSFE